MPDHFDVVIIGTSFASSFFCTSSGFTPSFQKKPSGLISNKLDQQAGDGRANRVRRAGARTGESDVTHHMLAEYVIRGDAYIVDGADREHLITRLTARKLEILKCADIASKPKGLQITRPIGAGRSPDGKCSHTNSR